MQKFGRLTFKLKVCSLFPHTKSLARPLYRFPSLHHITRHGPVSHLQENGENTRNATHIAASVCVAPSPVGGAPFTALYLAGPPGESLANL